MAFFQEARPRREPFLQAPAVVLWLIGAIVLAHIVRMLLPAQLSTDVVVNFSFLPVRYASHNPGNWLEQALPFVSYIFIHADLAHLLINSLWLLAFGPIVARRYGAALFLAFFFICGVAAAATHLAFNWGSPDPVIGASGAISGLMAAGIRMLRVSPRSLDQADTLNPIFSPQTLIFTAFWVLVNVLAGVTGFGAGGHVRLIAWQAHLGGYFVGLFLAAPFDSLRRITLRKSRARP